MSPQKILSGHLPLWHLSIVKKDPSKISLKFGQNLLNDCLQDDISDNEFVGVGGIDHIDQFLSWWSAGDMKLSPSIALN